jgi:hypothetical protein
MKSVNLVYTLYKRGPCRVKTELLYEVGVETRGEKQPHFVDR